MSAAMSKNEEQVLVVKREFFDGLGSFQGLCRRVDDYLPAFMKKENNFFVPRGAAEEDPSLKQIIPYAVFPMAGAFCITHAVRNPARSASWRSPRSASAAM